jgi:hypothetical protein
MPWAKRGVVGRYEARIEIVGDDCFAAVPTGDVYVFKFILRDWDDERSGRTVATRARLTSDAVACSRGGFR